MHTALRTVRGWHRPLVCFVVAMMALGLICVVGYAADDRILVGVPIWAKPLKFSVSFALYAVTLAWMLSLVESPRLRRVGNWAGTLLVGAAVGEQGAIVLQVLRGRQSHFNTATPFDTAVYAVMGVLVVVIYVCTLVIALALVRTRLADRAVALAVRLGLGVAVAGLSVGFFMVVPTDAQLTDGNKPALIGAHSVGVADGGPGVPLLGWSTTGGDLRIAHFIGMHALQALPLLAIALTMVPRLARLTERTRVKIVVLAAVLYAGVVGLTFWQALRGQPITSPDATTLGALAALLLVACVGAAVIARTARQPELVAA